MCFHKVVILMVGISIMFFAGHARAFFGAKHEPPDGKIFHGAQAEVRPAGIFSTHIDWDGIEAYAMATGKRPKLIMHYITLDPTLFWLLKGPIEEIAHQPFDYIPQIGLDFYAYWPTYNRFRPTDITETIARGDYDERLLKLAALFKRMNRPVFLRLGYEFGGSGQGQYASWDHWPSAWRRIVKVFQEAGADQVAFVWNNLNENHFMDYYPGDEYVDWWGINIFGNHVDKDPLVKEFIKKAGDHGKPIMICESTPRQEGSIHGEKSWQDWYVPYFRLMEMYSHVKAFCYINASWKDYPDPSFKFDCRVQSDPIVSNKYRETLSDPKFINSERVE